MNLKTGPNDLARLTFDLGNFRTSQGHLTVSTVSKIAVFFPICPQLGSAQYLHHFEILSV